MLDVVAWEQRARVWAGEMADALSAGPQSAQAAVAELDALDGDDTALVAMVYDHLVVRWLADVATIYDTLDATEAEDIIRAWRLPPQGDMLALLLHHARGSAPDPDTWLATEPAATVVGVV